MGGGRFGSRLKRSSTHTKKDPIQPQTHVFVTFVHHSFKFLCQNYDVFFSGEKERQ